jgi:hypothetical protein
VLFHEQFCDFTVVNVTDVWENMMSLFDGLIRQCSVYNGIFGAN